VLTADFFTEGEAGNIGEHHVEEGQVHFFTAHQVQGVGAIVTDAGGKAFTF